MKQVDMKNLPIGKNEEVIGRFPCTQTQLRCWILNELEPGNPALNVAVRWEIRGRFKASSIEAAYRKVIERHEVLRTRFVDTPEGPEQEVLAATDFKMSVIDLRNVPTEHQNERVMKIADETASAPFDLSQANLFRVSLLMLENERGILLITAHQSCFDGWSIRVLGREVGEIAAAIDAGRIPELPELPLQYGDYALWQSEYMTGYGFETEKAFWLEQLGDAPYFEVASDHPRNAKKSNNGDIISVAKPLEFGESMNRATRAHRVSSYSFGVAVMSAFLHRLTGKETILFGSQIAGREDSDLEELIGVFINNLVMRLDFNGDVRFHQHIHDCSQNVENAINHQRMPFNKLVELINPPRDTTRNPLISVNFNLQKAFLEDHRYGDFELISAPSQSPGVIYDLNFLMVGRPSGWRMSLEYNSDLFDKATAEAILNAWLATWEWALADGNENLSAIPVTSRLSISASDDPVSRIERLLISHEAVNDACLVATQGEKTWAFASAAPDYSGSLNDLPGKLARHLANYAGDLVQPEGISVLLALPRLADGALNEAALKALVPEKTVGSAPAALVATHVPSTLTKNSASENRAGLAKIWAELLDHPDVASNASFFELGGHSLLALRMISRVRQELGVKPDLALLFKAPNLEQFAAQLFGDDDEYEPDVDRPKDPWELISYREADGDLAVYTINHPFLYSGLTARLPETFPVYNLNMFGADLDKKLRSRSFESIAADAVGHIVQTSGNKPVALLGLCVNGVLSVEIARQLRLREIDVRFVGIVDSWAPNQFRKLPRSVQQRFHLRRRMFRCIHLTGETLRRRISLVTYLKRFDATLAMMRLFGISAGAETQEDIANGLVTDLLVDASRQHSEFGPLDNAFFLFKSKAMHPVAVREKFGWAQCEDNTNSVIELPGWHEDALTREGLSVVARHIITSTGSER